MTSGSFEPFDLERIRNMEKIAHKRINKDGSISVQSIKEHSVNVSELAEGFADDFDASELAGYIGILHDVGKYSDAFQRRINGSGEQVDHSSAGAKMAWNSGSFAGRLASFCIGGHHTGLPDLGTKFSDPSDATLMGKVKRNTPPIEEYMTELPVKNPEMPEWFKKESIYDAFFLIKMLFSSLVDADYLDTELFMSEGRINRSIGDDINTLLKRIDEYIAPWRNPTTEINRLRMEILEKVSEKGERDRGLFTLTVPTGGGKTIASMSFAIRHIIKNRMRRIIYVIPYTSIIEQTQKVFESVFGKNNVVAHYSGVEYNNDESGSDRRYLATENWDAPIILTTAVQFFESIYGNRTSKCRKIHNIANSTIVFDEAQMLPVSLLKPCVLAISNLISNYRCSAILCTATQPALNPLLKDFLPGKDYEELCPDTLFENPVFTRVIYKYIGKQSDDSVVQMLKKSKQVLCIVNTRKQAQEIFKKLPEEGRFHLSTTMMAEHRITTIERIRKCLSKGQVCRVVSTSLIEAGVDIDFPMVLRELSGIDSILQAGGRCNREGKRDKEESYVYIYELSTGFRI